MFLVGVGRSSSVDVQLHLILNDTVAVDIAEREDDSRLTRNNVAVAQIEALDLFTPLKKLVHLCADISLVLEAGVRQLMQLRLTFFNLPAVVDYTARKAALKYAVKDENSQG
jgi:hypothetical protein